MWRGLTGINQISCHKEIKLYSLSNELCFNNPRPTHDQLKPTQDYLIHLKSSEPDCEFTCSNCNFDLQLNHRRDQFIWGLNNDTLQTDIPAKACQIKILEDVVKQAEVFEAALWDEQSLQGSSKVISARSSWYKKIKKENPITLNHAEDVDQRHMNKVNE